MYKLLRMKILKIILISLAAIVALFLSLGLFVPAYEYDAAVTVNSTPEKCWTVFHDTIRMHEWLPGFESLTLKRGEHMQPGSVYEIIINDEDQRYVMSERITEISPPAKIAYVLDNEVLRSEFSYHFEGTTTTNIQAHFRVRGNNILWRAILFLSRSYMRSSGQEQLDLFKKAVEKQ